MSSLGGSVSELKELTHSMDSHLSLADVPVPEPSPAVRPEDVDELRNEMRRSTSLSAVAAVSALLALSLIGFGYST
jgi:hypothetical protein